MYACQVDEQAIPPSHGTLLKHASPEAASETSSASTCHNCMDSEAPASMNQGSFALDSGAAPLSLQKSGGLLKNHAMPGSALTSSHAAEDSMSFSTVQVGSTISPLLALGIAPSWALLQSGCSSGTSSKHARCRSSHKFLSKLQLTRGCSQGRQGFGQGRQVLHARPTASKR